MSMSEILAELPKLKPEELAEVQAKLDELTGELWLDDGELSHADKAALDAALAEYRKNPHAGGPWAEIRARIRANMRWIGSKTLAAGLIICSISLASPPATQPMALANPSDLINVDMSNSSKLTAAQIKALQATANANPADAQSRAQLLGHYLFQQDPNPDDISTRRDLILWMIRNRPDDRFAGTPFCGIDPAADPKGYAAARDLWKQQTEKPSPSPGAVENAVRFLIVNDAKAAEDLVNRAEAADPNNPQWHQDLAEIYSSPIPTTEPAEKLARRALAEREKAFLLTKDPQERFYLLTDLPAAAIVCDDKVKTTEYAKQLLTAAAGFKDDWNYGNAIHKANLALGRVALASGDIETAKARLLDAGKTPGSPQLDSFGPNMELARRLLEKGQKDVVLQYLDLCGKFWEMDNGNLKAWKQTIKAGGIPDFGANLIY